MPELETVKGRLAKMLEDTCVTDVLEVLAELCVEKAQKLDEEDGGTTSSVWWMYANRVGDAIEGIQNWEEVN